MYAPGQARKRLGRIPADYLYRRAMPTETVRANRLPGDKARRLVEGFFCLVCRWNGLRRSRNWLKERCPKCGRPLVSRPDLRAARTLLHRAEREHEAEISQHKAQARQNGAVDAKGA